MMFCAPYLATVVAFICLRIDDVIGVGIEVWFVASCACFLEKDDVIASFVELFL